MQTSCLSCDAYRCDARNLLWVRKGFVVTDGGATIHDGHTPIFL